MCGQTALYGDTDMCTPLASSQSEGGGTGAPTLLALTVTIGAGWGARESRARKRKGRGTLTEDAETEKQAGLGAAGDSPGQGRLPGSRTLGSERPPRPSTTLWNVTNGRKQTPHRVE